jgi:hypothetical protein
LSSCTGKLGNLTLEDDGSCGHLSLNKTVRSIDIKRLPKNYATLRTFVASDP